MATSSDVRMFRQTTVRAFGAKAESFRYHEADSVDYVTEWPQHEWEDVFKHMSNVREVDMRIGSSLSHPDDRMIPISVASMRLRIGEGSDYDIMSLSNLPSSVSKLVIEDYYWPPFLPSWTERSSERRLTIEMDLFDDFFGEDDTTAIAELCESLSNYWRRDLYIGHTGPEAQKAVKKLHL